ncbi:MAG: histidine kinase [Sporolactobacillus sp.]
MKASDNCHAVAAARETWLNKEAQSLAEGGRQKAVKQQYMEGLIDKAILFIACLLASLPAANVAAALAAVIAAGLLSYVEAPRWRALCAELFIVFSALYSPGTLFLPLIGYDLLADQSLTVGLTALLPFCRYISGATLREAFTLAAVTLLALLVSRRSAALAARRNRYYDLRDGSRELARELRRKNSELLRQQDSEVTVATLAERNRIARDIHDGVGHLLSSALLQVGALLAARSGDQAQTDPLLTLSQTLSEAMNSIRASVHRLYDESIDLQEQLSGLAAQFNFCPLEVVYSVREAPPRDMKYALIAITKEAFNNIARHSHATQARMTMREHPAFYQLIIADNGRSGAMNRHDGIGLKNMQSRVEAFHGQFQINMANGFELFITMPKKMGR